LLILITVFVLILFQKLSTNYLKSDFSMIVLLMKRRCAAWIGGVVRPDEGEMRNALFFALIQRGGVCAEFKNEKGRIA